MTNNNSNDSRYITNTYNQYSRELREMILMMLVAAALFIGLGSGFVAGSIVSHKSFNYGKSITGVYTMINSNNNIIYHGE